MQESDISSTDLLSEQPVVSVVIPIRNARALLDFQLNALAQQDFDGPFEVIISDNGSTDGLADHIATHALRDVLGLIYVDASNTAGASFARNVGAERARSELLAFCDADDVVGTAWLRSIVIALETHDVVGTALEENSLNHPRTVETSPLGTPQEQGRTPFLPFAIGASLGCRQTTYRKLGGMVVGLHAGEDVEFSWHAQMEGFQFHFIEHPLVAYRLRAEVRAMWTQALTLGLGTAHLRSLYLEHGAPHIRAWPSIKSIAILAVVNPALPSRLTGMSRGRWVRLVGANFGLLIGGVKHRALGW